MVTKKTTKKETEKKTEKKTYRKSPAKKAERKKTEKAYTGTQEKLNKPKKKKIRAPEGLFGQILPFIVGLLAVIFAGFLLLPESGLVGTAVKNVLFGLFAGAAYTIPLFWIFAAFMWRKDRENEVLGWKLFCNAVTFFLVTVAMHFFAKGQATFSLAAHYKNGQELLGGGVVGGLIGEFLCRACGYTLSLILLFAVAFLFLLLMFGVTPRSFCVYVAYKWKMRKERLAKEREETQNEDDEPYRIKKKRRMKEESVLFGDEFSYTDEAEPGEFAGTLVVDADGNHGAVDPEIFDEVMRRTRDRMDQMDLEETIAPERGPADVMDDTTLNSMAEDELDLSRIFTEGGVAALKRTAGQASGEDAADLDLALTVQRTTLLEDAEKPAPKEESPTPQEYAFPPISLLIEDQSQKDENVAEELRENAARLVETLKNFNVRTKIVDICRGPTITRYELAPEPGTKVRSIANLVDDIALNLATSGVRFEPSIPGKSAVGIEVPNKNAATVHLRTLLENPRFGTAKSRLTAALGQDVGGADVFLDVAKMPHLLIAGATGQGKSVCINSLIVSLLYKSKPEELKFIMVDPKKVELNVYNGIPHLYMPVISDPKKAAGALSWAVSEMERRYSLIEEVGVRDVKTYNEITKNDPSYEYLPQFVIIIDELADLMMVARNDVEAPICRIAQKARAAGMHLIVGTQRPSVDVITGLIKANFPSRISFRVSQLVDSRTIIDRAGAESLVGRGDMLYSPVGAHEPMRVQGAFVSDEEVERVVEFIKNNNGSAEYNAGAIAEVERNAASIGTSGKKSGGSDEESGAPEDDPMLRPAIELAVENGKISTSLIQRRLSLGYGRAAKLIDRMEQLGYVSAPEGQKPRDVLITREQFMEMVLRDTDS